MQTSAAALALWTAGKTPSVLGGPAPPSGPDLCFVNERADGVKLTGVSLEHGVFSNVSFLEGELTKIDFSHGTFYRCYFRKTKIRGCNFTGCRFVECEFPEADILNSQFSYSRWEKTDIDAGVILSNLPDWPNVAHSLLVALRVNAIAKGDGIAARKFLFRAMAYTREHNWRIAFSDTSYYRAKYKGSARIVGFLRWCALAGEWLVWGYGENPFWVFLFGNATLVGFAAYYLAAAHDKFDNATGLTMRAVGSAFLYSVRAFTSADAPPNLSYDLFPIATTLQSSFGLVFVSVLGAVVYRWLTVRSF